MPKSLRFLLLVLPFLFVNAAGAAKSPCRIIAQDAWQSCRLGARDDYWLARGICTNIAAAGCADTAGEDQDDTLAECDDQYAARLDVCEEVGQGRYEPAIDPAHFTADVTNPYFPLTPGKVFRYESNAGGHLEVDEVHVTHDVKVIAGVPCRVVHDVATRDGEVIEDTLDWYSQDSQGNVWYFGEESRQYEDGELIDIQGSWKAGRNQAQPGIIMEAHPQAGDAYRQEFALEEAEDLGRVVMLNASVTVPYGSFNPCLVTEDFSSLEPGVIEHKYYASGVGTVLEIDADGGRVELVSVTNE
jgi:hypothetical protein